MHLLIELSVREIFINYLRFFRIFCKRLSNCVVYTRSCTKH